MVANEEIIRLRREYEKLLRGLDPQIKQAFSNLITRTEFLISDGQYNASDAKELSRLIQQLQSELRTVGLDTAVAAIALAKKTKAAEFGPYLAELQQIVRALGLAQAEVAAAVDLPRLVPVFGGGLDKQILDGVWNKIWPDSLNVDDRIKRLGQRTLQKAEQIIKSGIAEGRSAQELARELRGYFEAKGLERKAAFRLAAHTTNMTYQAAQAEISIQARFVMGIRIVRGMYGDMDPNCQICDEHGGQDFKEYYKDDFGGQNSDMWVMANAPAYHNFCNCGIETIFEDAVTFIRNAVNGSNEQAAFKGWELGEKSIEQFNPGTIAERKQFAGSS